MCVEFAGIVQDPVTVTVTSSSGTATGLHNKLLLFKGESAQISDFK